MKNALIAVLAVGLAGCGLLEAEANSKDICVLQSNIAEVPASPPVSVPSTPPVTLLLDLGDAVPDLEDEGVEADINPEALTLGSVSGNVDFRGVETLTLTVQPPPDRPDLEPAVFRYERTTPASDSVFALPARPVSPVDLADYLEGDFLRITGTFSGSAPAQSWTATLELCSSTQVRVDYWKRITG
jgi:hypothetical protein